MADDKSLEFSKIIEPLREKVQKVFVSTTWPMVIWNNKTSVWGLEHGKIILKNIKQMVDNKSLEFSKIVEPLREKV